MSQSPIQAAIQQICQEKNLSEDVVLRAIEAALAAAYRKDFGNKLQNIITEFDPKTGETKVFDVKTVIENVDEVEEATEEEKAKEEKKKTKKMKEEVGGNFAAAFALALAEKQAEEEAGKGKIEEEKSEPAQKSFLAEEIGEFDDEKKFNPKTEIQLNDAREIDPKYKIGDEIVTPLEVPGEFGRMAAQTAKQVIIQKLREEERLKIFEEYKGLEHTLIIGTIQRREGRNVFVDIGNAVAIMPPEEQVDRERYNVGNRMKFYLKSVDQGARGSMIVVSRADNELVRFVFEEEIPEITTGSIEIKSIAREPGNRTKVAIASNEENVDPIGSCVGQRGSRIQTIIGELNNEKVDIILWDENPAKFITNSLSPAKVANIEIDQENKSAKVTVNEDQLSLAIGRGGQNVRLASRLTEWKIDIVGEGGVKPPKEGSEETGSEETATKAEAEEVAIKASDEETTEVEAEKNAAETPNEDAEVAEEIKEAEATEEVEKNQE